MSQKSPNVTKILYTKFELDLWGVRMGANLLKVWKYYRGPTNKVLIVFNFGVRTFRLDERIPNLILKLKSDNIWLPPLLAKKLSKTVKNWQNSQIWQISTVFEHKRVSSVVRFQFWGQIWNHLILAKLSEPKWKKIDIFLALYSFSKNSTNLCSSIHLTDLAKISCTVFWYHKATFERSTHCTFQKSVLRSTLVIGVYAWNCATPSGISKIFEYGHSIGNH